MLVQHEYGIFGGEGGEYLLDLTAALEVPYVATLHTLLEKPTPRQAEVLRRLAAGAAQVTVFTAAARDDLVRQGVAPADRVSVVHHGAPAELQARPPASARRRTLPAGDSGSLPELGPHRDRRVLSTFGLLSSGKGIEVAIRALTTVRETHPDVLYVVAGRTHPQVVRTEGERYRESLQPARHRPRPGRPRALPRPLPQSTTTSARCWPGPRCSSRPTGRRSRSCPGC